METMNEEERLRNDVELGRKAKIAEEVLNEFLDRRKEEIIRKIESAYFDANNIETTHLLVELRVIGGFRDDCKRLISQGKWAEKELETYGE